MPSHHPISLAVSSTTSRTIATTAAAPKNTNSLAKFLQVSIWKTTLISLSFATARQHRYCPSVVSVSSSSSSSIHFRSYATNRLVAPRQTFATTTTTTTVPSSSSSLSSRCCRFAFVPPSLPTIKNSRMTTLSSTPFSSSSSSSMASPPPPPSSSSKNNKKLVIIIAGPTAVGKSSVAAKICSTEVATSILRDHAANNHNNNENHTDNIITPLTTTTTTRGHIVSADSVQTYRGVQIGANKPTMEERESTPHHLIDILEGDSICDYNAADWMRDAIFVIDDLTTAAITTTGDDDDDNDDDDDDGDDNEDDRDEKRPRIDDDNIKNDNDNDEHLRRKVISKRLSQSRQPQPQVSYDHKSIDGTTKNNSNTPSLSPPILPVVVGGTMMYLQWLVHGRPDAVKPSAAAATRAVDVVTQFQSMRFDSDTTTTTTGVHEGGGNGGGRSSASTNGGGSGGLEDGYKNGGIVDNGDEGVSSLVSLSDVQKKKRWNAAVSHISSLGPVFAKRVSTLSEGDWYRLQRTLEVAYTVLPQYNNNNNNGTELNTKSTTTTTTNHQYKIDDTLYTGQRQGGLLTSPHYDVRCFFLCPDDRMAHTAVVDSRCEDMLVGGLLSETTDLRLGGNLPESGQPARAIGYRQTLAYLEEDLGGGDEVEEMATTAGTVGDDVLSSPSSSLPQLPVNDGKAFGVYLDEFTTATRRYAKKQMQWFRKDDEFVFVPVRVGGVKDENDDDSQSLPLPPVVDRVEEACRRIRDMCVMERGVFERELLMMDAEIDEVGVTATKDSGVEDDDDGGQSLLPLSARTKRRNQEQGKKMKLYRTKRHTLIEGSHMYEKVLAEADDCRARIAARNSTT